MKKIFTIIVVILMLISLMGCGEEVTTDNTGDEEVNNNVENDIDEEEIEEDMEEEYEGEEDADDIVMEFDVVDLAEEYPEDIVPIIPSGDVEYSAKDGEEILAKVYCKEDPEKVNEYYLDILEGSENFEEDYFADVYFLDGVIDGYTISIKITGDEYYNGYLTSLTIVVK